MKTAAQCIASAYAGGAAVWLYSAAKITIARRNKLTEPRVLGAVVGTALFWPASVFYAIEDAL